MATARSTERQQVASPDTGHGRPQHLRTSPRETDPNRRTIEAREARLSKALEEVPRHLFFPAGMDWQIPNDQPVPLGRGRTIPPVDVVAMMLRALELEGTERVLEIGGGSGYQAALLGRLAREVVSVDVDEELVKRARSLLGELEWPNVRLIHADAYGGWPEAAQRSQKVCASDASLRNPQQSRFGKPCGDGFDVGSARCGSGMGRSARS